MLDLKDGAKFGNAVLAPTFLGNLDASFITTGTLSSERLPSTLGNASTVYIGNGAGLTGLDASSIQGLEDLSSNSVTANFFFGNGSALSNLSASAITSGVLANNYLPSTLQVDHVIAQDFTGNIDVANLEFLIQSGGSFEATVGNVNQPGYAFDTDASTGIYRPQTSTLGFVSGGVESAQLSQLNGLVVNSNVSAHYFKGNGALLTGVILSGGEAGTSNASNITAGVLATAYGGTGTTSSTGTGNVVLSNDPVLYGNVVVVGNVSSQNFTGNVDLGDLDLIFDSGSYFEANVGNVTQPSYAFDSETSTGIYRPLESTLGFVANGTELARLSEANGLVVNGTVTASSFAGNLDIGNLVLEIQDGGLFRANLGTNLQPSYAFVGETTTGLYRPAESTIGFVAGGVEKAQISTTGFLVNGNVQAQYYTGNGSQLTGILSSPSLTISNVQITDSSYTVSDDLALSTTSGGYIQVNGSGFAPGSIVGIGTDLAIATVYVSGTQIRAQAPAKSSGSYNVSVIRGDTTTATLPLAVAYSASPVWGTSSILSDVRQNVAFMTTLAATSDSNVVYSNASTLPPQTTLASNGTFSGNITSVADDTVYAFTIKATDVELQDTLRTFQLTYLLQFIITDIVAGGQQSFVIARKQSYGFGYNRQGQLGIINTTGSYTNPTPTSGMDGSLAGKSVSVMATSSSHTIVLCTDGSLHGFGNNYYGALGISTNNNYEFPNTPINISNRGSLNGRTVSTVACGSNFTIVLCTDGTLHAFGSNYHGALGTTVNSGIDGANPTPMNISSNGSLSGKTITKIVCSVTGTYTIVFCSDGSIHGFGRNNNGQLGTTTNNGVTTPNPTPAVITSLGSLSGKTVSKITCGADHTVVLCTDGSLHGFGSNYYGQLGTTTNSGTGTPNPTPFLISSNGSLAGKTVSDVSCGVDWTIVLCTDGSLHGFGNNYYASLGTTNVGTYTPISTPIQITSLGSLAGKTVSKIACGFYHTLAFCSDKSVHAWGYNYTGQLGTTTNNNTQTPIPTPALVTVTE